VSEHRDEIAEGRRSITYRGSVISMGRRDAGRGKGV